MARGASTGHQVGQPKGDIEGMKLDISLRYRRHEVGHLKELWAMAISDMKLWLDLSVDLTFLELY